MSRFPAPLEIPQHVKEERKERVRQLVNSSFWGIFLRLTIIAAELAGVYLFSSASLLMDALTSIVDVISSIILVVCIKLAARPPDTNHPFGHGRFEPLIGLQLGLFMAFVGGSMVIKQSGDLYLAKSDVAIDPRVWIIPFLAMFLHEACYQMVIRVAKRQNSTALAADAVHYRLDGMTSFCATVSLFTASFFPGNSHFLDHLGAVFIAVWMLVIGINAARQNIKQLSDSRPDIKFFNKVKYAAKRVQGVKEIEKIKIQLYGPDAHVNIDVEVDPYLTVEKAHRISQEVRVEIQKDWPSVQDVIVHIEPFYPNDH